MGSMYGEIQASSDKSSGYSKMPLICVVLPFAIIKRYLIEKSEFASL